MRKLHISILLTLIAQLVIGRLPIGWNFVFKKAADFVVGNQKSENETDLNLEVNGQCSRKIKKNLGLSKVNF